MVVFKSLTIQDLTAFYLLSTKLHSLQCDSVCVYKPKHRHFMLSASCMCKPETLNCLPQVAEAAELWDGTGALVFSSSAGLYEVDDGSHCNEDCKIADRGKSERTDK